MTSNAGAVSARRITYNTLRNRIISLELPPGSLLSENELAQALGCSRTPVREALILLADNGLVHVVPRKGTFVSSLSLDDIRDAQFLRESVELHALDSISFPLNDDVVARIHTNLDHQRESIERGPSEFFSLDEEFHQLLLELSGHRRLWQQVADYKTHLDRARFLGLTTRDSLARFHQEHVQITESLLAEDLAAAHATLCAHLRIVLDDLKSAMTRYPAIFKLTELAETDL